MARTAKKAFADEMKAHTARNSANVMSFPVCSCFNREQSWFPEELFVSAKFSSDKLLFIFSLQAFESHCTAYLFCFECFSIRLLSLSFGHPLLKRNSNLNHRSFVLHLHLLIARQESYQELRLKRKTCLTLKSLTCLNKQFSFENIYNIL